MEAGIDNKLLFYIGEGELEKESSLYSRLEIKAKKIKDSCRALGFEHTPEIS